MRLREAHKFFCMNFFQKLPKINEKWKFIKQKISPSKKSVKVDEIRLDSGEISREPKNIINCLNRSIANLVVFKGSDIACGYPDKFNAPELTFRIVNRKGHYSAIDSLDDNNAAGPGEISIRLLKSYKLAIGVHLQFALNECITETIFLIFKKADKLDKTNYRPISVTPSFAKIFERLNLTQMTDFLDKHKIFNKEQFGYQKNSATDAALELVEIISSKQFRSKHRNCCYFLILQNVQFHFA